MSGEESTSVVNATTSIDNSTERIDIEEKHPDSLLSTDRHAVPSTSATDNRYEDVEADVSHNVSERSPLISSINSEYEDEATHSFIGQVCTILHVTILNLAMVIIGALTLNKCEVLNPVPIFLLVIGAAGLVLKPPSIFCQKYSKYTATCLMCVFSVLEFAVIICVSYWIYSRKPDFNPSNPAACHKVDYYLVFWLTTVYWIILAVGASFLCCACFLTCVISSRLSLQ